jgi:hypothetical protein
MQFSVGRLVLAEDMTYRMFDAGYSIGKEFMIDIGELLNLPIECLMPDIPSERNS